MKFRHDPAAVRGAVAALITPFTADGDLDETSLERLVRWQLASGAHGVSIGGSTGEPSAQTIDERKRAIRLVARAVNDEVPFVAGVGTAKLDETLELTGCAQDAGADLVLVITPYYAKPTQDGLFAWYGAVAREFPDLPIAVYNVPTRTAVDVAPETVARLRRAFPNIVGVKETTKDFEHFSRVLHACDRDVLVWSGIELLCLPLLSLGGVGFVSALMNLVPRATAAMYDAWVAGDHAEAQRLHFAMHPLADLLFIETNPAPAKWVLAHQGRIAADAVRAPLVSLTPGGQDIARRVLAGAADLLDQEVPTP